MEGTNNGICRAQQIIAVLWPSFLTAGIAVIIFFTLFDPLELFPSHDVERIGVYTMGFFSFWALTAVSSALTCYFERPCENKNLKKTPPKPSV